MAPTPFRWDALSKDERDVLRVLVKHRGKANAVTVPAVADAVGLNCRRTQKVVKALLEVHGIPMGTSYSHEAPGWYVCETEDERKENRQALRGRALSILQRAKAFDPRWKTHLAELFQGQEPLPLGGSDG